MNTITILGRLTANPEFRTTQTGKKVANFTIAEGDKNKTNYIECQAWEKRAEFLQTYFTKGKPILVTGSLNQERWEKDGKKYSKLIANVNQVDFVPNDTTAKREDSDDLPEISLDELGDAIKDMPF